MSVAEHPADELSSSGPARDTIDAAAQAGAPVAQADALAAREERLVSILTRARRRSGGGLTERWLGGIGAGLAVAGLMLVVIGWVGTSRTVLVAGQIPYVVSGGLLGLALVFLGGFVYFGYWLALVVRQGRERAEQDRADVTLLASELVEVNRSLATIASLLGPAQDETNSKARPNGRAAPNGKAASSRSKV
jgi:hypothetical protein